MVRRGTGLGRADLHMHTCASDGVPTVRELLDHVECHTNLDVIAITDHDRVDSALWAYDHQDEYSFEIIPGVEITSRVGHVLGLWVWHNVPAGLSLTETVSAIHEQGGVAILAHPYHFYIDQVRLYVRRYTRQPELLVEAGLDGLEIHNAGIMLPGLNLLARRLGQRVHLTATGGSDAHTLNAIGSGLTRFAGHTANDLRRALASKKTVVEGSAWPLTAYWNYLRLSTPNTSSEFLAERLPSDHQTYQSHSLQLKG
ncbi:MAG: CehA/McbA family metallohydrolase [Chloroflexota bacterium]